ncbi:hypothetical protein WN943_004649 [Citrus x changshan-huyou]
MARTPAVLTASDASNASWVHPDVVNDASFFLRQNMHRTFLSVEEEAVEFEDMEHKARLALHPLLFNEDNKNYNEQILCFGWGEKVLMDPSYNCYQCDDFMLDKTYAELPHKIKNPFAGKRPLVPLKNLHLLLGYIAFVVSAENFALVLFMVVLIAACGENLSSTSPAGHYGCVECKYFLHKTCAELPNEINHFLHPQHPLTLIAEFNSYNYCNACTDLSDGFFYDFFKCNFCIHSTCSSLPRVRKFECHLLVNQMNEAGAEHDVAVQLEQCSWSRA